MKSRSEERKTYQSKWIVWVIKRENLVMGRASKESHI
jgi:hypothetical protein